ncbi:MAG: hypothetical protein BV458_04620 [Thermoplasmata archaeon M9B2D]|nr:MAG: hypothetical protein BV458_04620 [Thermoplasmata archaeon M9B2D]
MRLIYLVNGISKTSIPWRWAEFFNRHSSLLKVKMVSIGDLTKKIADIRKSVDIVHGHHVKAMALFLVINIFLRKKSVYTVHGSYLFLSRTNAALLNYIFRYADRIVFVNKMLYDVLPLDMKHLINNKYEIILNGVETNYSYVKQDVYKKYSVDESDTVLFHPARFVPEKNHLRMIRALKSLVEKDRRIKLLLAGDGRLKKDIEEQIIELGLEKNVVMLGLIERDEVYNFLERCDLFLMPSLSEGLNIAFLEAISMHCRVVVSDIEQFVYPLQAYGLDPDDLNVTFVDPLDENVIALGMQSALEKERKRTYDSSDFSLETMMHKYESVYGRLLA